MPLYADPPPPMAQPICAKCGRRPVPPKLQVHGRQWARCLACAWKQGGSKKTHELLQLAAKTHGMGYASKVASAGGIALPDKVRDEAEDSVWDSDESAVMLLACGLGMTDGDIERAASLVGVKEHRAKKLEDRARAHELTRGDSASIARVMGFAAGISAVKALGAASGGLSENAQRFATTVSRLNASVDTLTGGARIVPPKITVVFRTLRGDEGS